ncbi:heat shock protein 30D-like [Aquarana catesbeiana]|uniref:heat shock protein 30D-like n=1 Tax=Aquarana catesbeiana TaxID=8400 RepID=UPI003CCA5186
MFRSSHFQPNHEIHNFNLSHDVEILHQQLQDDLQRMQYDVERRMEWMQRECQIPPHHLDLGQRAIQSRRLSTPRGMLLSRRWNGNGNGNFELSLDVDQVPPGALTVKTEGRKLIVTAKHDEKKETADGRIVHEHRELHREAELPEDVNPKDVLCSMSRDGRLHFQAPRMALPAAENRIIPLHREIHIPIRVDSKWAIH